MSQPYTHAMHGLKCRQWAESGPVASGLLVQGQELAGFAQSDVLLCSLISSVGTKTHLKPSGAGGFCDLAQPFALSSSRLSRPKTSMAARISPMAAKAHSPQNVTRFIDITAFLGKSGIVGGRK